MMKALVRTLHDDQFKKLQEVSKERTNVYNNICKKKETLTVLSKQIAAIQKDITDFENHLQNLKNKEIILKKTEQELVDLVGKAEEFDSKTDLNNQIDMFKNFLNSQLVETPTKTNNNPLLLDMFSSSTTTTTTSEEKKDNKSKRVRINDSFTTT